MKIIIEFDSLSEVKGSCELSDCEEKSILVSQYAKIHGLTFIRALYELQKKGLIEEDNINE